jgi:bile acid-coenzyme A ligase
VTEHLEPISFGGRIAELAKSHPDRPALIFASQQTAPRGVTWHELHRESNRVARQLADRGGREGSIVVVALPNCPEHFLASIGAWKIGACVLPLSMSMPLIEYQQLLEIAHPSVIVSDWRQGNAPVVSLQELRQRDTFSDACLADRIAVPGKAIASGGSTARPKIIVDPSPWAKYPGQWLDALGRSLGMRSHQVHMVAGPLYHNGPFTWAHMGLFEDHTLILMEKFDAAKWADLVEQYSVNFGFMVPTMMHRIIQVPGIWNRDLSSVEAFFHAGAPCAPWLKEAWIELIGAEKLYELFGATEAVGFTTIRGDEWLKHRGSVGLPYNTELRIVDDGGEEVPAGVVGEIFTRLKNPIGLGYYYLGSPSTKTTSDGFASVGDMGWVDEQGYLFLADRRVDLILSGGANIYPAEVEAALSEFPGIADVVVIGVPEEPWGQSVHAVVETVAGMRVSIDDLDAHCRKRLTPYKVPKSYEFVAQLPRTEAGKLRRSDLMKEHLQGWTPNMLRVSRMYRQKKSEGSQSE